jgi:hypothetical protein
MEANTTVAEKAGEGFVGNLDVVAKKWDGRCKGKPDF